MARAKRSVEYNADAATIARYFDEAMAAKDVAKNATAEISALNTQMQSDGVHVGVLAHYVGLARMKPDEAALRLALEDFYRQALASRLPEPVAETPTKAAAHPFGGQRRTAAA